MKILIPFACAVLFIASCQQPEEIDQSITLTGTITNASDSKISLRGADIDTTITFEGDSFNFKFDADAAAYYRFRTSGEYTSMYLSSGDSLNITLDTSDFDNTITYSGDGADLNQYLANGVLLKNELPSNKDLFALNEAEFLIKLDSITEAKSTLLTKNNFVNETFVMYELAKINYEKLTNQFRLENYHRHYANEPDFEVSDGYIDNINGYDLNDSTLLEVSAYKNFLETYLSGKTDNRMKADTIKYKPNEDGAYVEATLDQLEESVSNNMVKSTLMYDFLNIYMTYIDQGTYVTYLEKFNNINSNQKKEDKLNKQFEDWKKLAKGTQAPNFKYVSFAGDSLTMDDFKGKYVYIDVWATWCGPCLRELPSLEKLQEEFKDKNVTFMSVSIDNTPEPWKKMVENKEMKGVQLYADGAWNSTLVKDYMIGGIPRFILVDTEGKLISASTERPSGGIKEILEGLEKI
jgi:thiol-disulfide isomerase/thioredoxin